MSNIQILNDNFDLDAFWEKFASVPNRLLLLDYDGTLAPFRNERDKATPYPGVRDLLQNMMQAQHSRVVIISGRATKDLLPLLGLDNPPEIWGSHGLERLKTDGAYEVTELDSVAENTLQQALEWAHSIGLQEHTEQKPGAVAVHWRGMKTPAQERLQSEFLQKWSAPAEAAGLALKEFDGGIELRVTVKNKGDAVNTILSEVDQDEAVAAYLGDDFTDEDAFRAIKERGLSVLVRREFRETEADIWLQPPEDLLQFLHRWQATAMQ